MKRLFCVRNKVTGKCLSGGGDDTTNPSRILWFERKTEAKKLRDQFNKEASASPYVVSLGPEHRRYTPKV